MKPTAVLFDLDGTLLPMDMDTFTHAYFGALAQYLAPYGYAPKALVGAIWQGISAMVQNDGTVTNEVRFWDAFCAALGEGARSHVPLLGTFYREKFDAVQAVCGYTAQAAQTVRAIKCAGYRVALATNPVFPRIATQRRMAWAGLDEVDFELYTTYENASYCKPNPAYYLDVAARMGVDPADCLMVGNDIEEDIEAARRVGMDTFLLPACLLNSKQRDLAPYKKGDFSDLLSYLGVTESN